MAGNNIMATRERIARAVDAQLAAATKAGKQRRSRGAWARSARYESRSKRLLVELESEVIVSIPVRSIQGLAKAPAAVIRSVEIAANGYGLYWPELDLDLSVPDLIGGSFGTQVWMSELARQGGKARSAAKAAAARENGKRGGRPRKGAPVVRRAVLPQRRVPAA